MNLAVTGVGHSFGDKTWRTFLVRTVLLRALRLLLNRPRNHVVVQNPDDRELLIDRGVVSADRVLLIKGSGVDVQHFVPVQEPPGIVTVAAVTWMLSIKGVPVLLEAHRLLRCRGVDLRLLLAGTPDPESPSSLSEETLQRWAAEPGVVWLGPTGSGGPEHEHQHD